MCGDRGSGCCLDCYGTLCLSYFLYHKTADGLSRQPLDSLPVRTSWHQKTPVPMVLPKLLVKPSGKLERLCKSSEHPFHLKLCTTRVVTELSIETNNDQ
jgi:hypothetical protein